MISPKYGVSGIPIDLEMKHYDISPVNLTYKKTKNKDPFLLLEKILLLFVIVILIVIVVIIMFVMDGWMDGGYMDGGYGLATLQQSCPGQSS